MKDICFKIFQQKHVIDLLLYIAIEKRGFNTIQKELSINTASLQKKLLEMERANFIKKEHCPNDARAYYYLITKRGQMMANILLQLKNSFNKDSMH